MDVPPIRYTLTADGVNIAYQVVGDGPFDLVFVPQVTSNIDIFWENPRWASFMRDLAAFSRLLLFDRRGVGLSDRAIGVPPLEQRMDGTQLRKLLGKNRLATRSPGYVLRVEEGELDLHEFEALLQQARDAAPADAAVALSEALALWRGPPLADFAFDRFAQAEIARLEELRVEATEERLELDLALGRHCALIAELEALVAQHPLRERMRGQLMLAMYRSGRQAEALEAYQDARRALVEELGIEPNRVLRELEQAILRQDPTLEVCVEAEPEGGSPARDVETPEPSLPTYERKLATVLFADLAGSTKLEERDPERTRAELERLHDAVAEEIRRAGGTVEGLIGHTVMAVFGVPAAQEDHPERALHAALAMRRRFGELFGDSLRLSMGVNTGEVVAEQTLAGDSIATGDAVNMAARLVEAAGPGEILVGDRTAAAARGAFEFGDPTTAETKHKAQRIACRRLLRPLSMTRPRGIGGLGRAFVGREQELALLRSAYERCVHASEPHLVTIIGDAGVGKTSLTRQLSVWLGAQLPQPLLRGGRCLPYGRGITYWPLAEVLKEHFGITESDSPETVRERLGEREILGLTLGLEVATELHPLVARERLHETWVDLLDEVVAVCPAAILVEDLHWAEKPLLDFARPSASQRLRSTVAARDRPARAARHSFRLGCGAP